MALERNEFKEDTVMFYVNTSPECKKEHGFEQEQPAIILHADRRYKPYSLTTVETMTYRSLYVWICQNIVETKLRWG